MRGAKDRTVFCPPSAVLIRYFLNPSGASDSGVAMN